MNLHYYKATPKRLLAFPFELLKLLNLAGGIEKTSFYLFYLGAFRHF